MIPTDRVRSTLVFEAGCVPPNVCFYLNNEHRPVRRGDVIFGKTRLVSTTDTRQGTHQEKYDTARFWDRCRARALFVSAVYEGCDKIA